ncbi:MAG TPA: glycosyltransferase family 39 protein [Chthoniobacterales bacterium]|nr:glycosyltransferase family 39 protein [Chthoniobacterales bacterium]
MDEKPAALAGPRSWVQRYPKTILVIVTLACLLPFADKAIHIDDPLFVWAGRQMQTQWSDPYGFDVNWYGWPMPMHEVTKNPPLACAWIAILMSIFGEDEFALHLGFFLQAIAMVLGTYALARRLCDHPFYAALAALCTPVFMISSTTLMCDVLMVAFWVWAVVFWMRGMEENRPLLLVLAALLVVAASLTKYFGIALVPLLLAYSLVRNRRAGWWLVYLVVPLAVMGVYEGAMRGLYGHGLMWDAFSYANQNEPHGSSAWFVKTVTALGFTGGCCAIALILAPVLWRSRTWVCAAIGGTILLPTTWILAGTLVSAESPARLGITLLWTLFSLGGMAVLALPILEWKHHRNGDALLLLLWVWGTFMFCILNWTINGRSILPMVPAVAIILLRRIEFVRTSANLRLTGFLGAAALFSLLVAFADYRLADSARAAATEIQSKFRISPRATIWFQGHWGFQYYAQANGFRAFDSANPGTRPGDLMVLPFNNTNLKPIPENTFERMAVIEIPIFPWVTSVSRPLGAGFYTDIVGPLPFGFGAVPPEKYYVVRFK